MSKLPGILSNWLALLQEKLPDRHVGLAPADAFFTRKVDLPENLSWEDKVAYIELALEGNAPFPMEQLAWGFLESPDSAYAFVYASPKSRLKRLNIEDPERFHQLFPGFLTLLGETFPQATVRFISQNGVLSALFLPAHNPVPEKIISRAVQADLLDDEALLASRQRLAASLQTEGYALEEGLWLGEGIHIGQDGQCAFTHRHVCTGSAPQGLKRHILALDEQALWAADLRDSFFAARERVTRQRSRLIWTLLRVASLTALLLLIFQVGGMGLSAYTLVQENKIAQLEPRATRVENKLTLADRLTRSTEEDLKPFLLMEAVNPLRPDSIYFEKVRSRAFNELEIEGQSSEGVTPVNAFADAVTALPQVGSVVNNSRTRNNQTSFEFLITFSELPPAPENGFVIPDENEEETEPGEEPAEDEG